ncbi:MAG TPA: tRNA (adenosine(37)-N6)-dimethylallyltransferase MiaA [Thermoanaerobaculia bacterium]|nr:tRNA (adenosine(37)-N6)-dimethylallyltransferase MiaA [Thermoanaerobaculia bacterium]
MPSEPPIVVVVGPTAVGKSALALRLARTVGAEIVNADALQVYRGLDIGTAKPTPAERRAVPHHLVDILEPAERFSAGEFARRARASIAEIRGRGRLPLVVGGSGFYVRALVEGLSPLPPADAVLREALRRRAAEEGSAALHAELARLDPEAAARLPPADAQRVVRALEVVLASGVPLSRWIARQPAGQTPLPAVKIGLTLPRSILYDHIGARVARMLERGWIGEVERLLARGVDPAAPAFQAIGYRQIVRALATAGHPGAALDEAGLDEAVFDSIVQATRRFAKRQMTWFRGEPEVRWFDPRRLSEDDSEVLELVRSVL